MYTIEETGQEVTTLSELRRAFKNKSLPPLITPDVLESIGVKVTKKPSKRPRINPAQLKTDYRPDNTRRDK